MVSLGNGIRREAGLLLLGGIIFGSSSMLKAAEKYVKDPNDAAVRYYNTFCNEFGNEIQKRRDDLKYADRMYLLDRMLEDTLFPYGLNYDTTINYLDEVEDFVTDILKDALDTTLKESDIYRDVRNDLQSNIRDLFGLQEVPEARSAGTDGYPFGNVCTPGLPWEPGVEPEPSNDEGVGNGFLGYGKVDTRVRSSLRRDDIRLSAYAKFEDLRLLGARFDNGKIEVSTKDNGRLRSYLESAISDEISCRFYFDVENIDDPGTNVGLGITGGKKNDRWVVTAGYRDGFPGDDGGSMYATAGIKKRF